MGMFDTVVCRLELPYPKDLRGLKLSEEFQTKDLGQALDHYFIGDKGKLWKVVRGEDGSDNKIAHAINYTVNIYSYCLLYTSDAADE